MRDDYIPVDEIPDDEDRFAPPMGEPAKQERASRFFKASTLAGKPVPVRPFHVPGFIPGRTVTLLNADGGMGKSLIALQLCCATALGRKWLNREVEPGRALFISAEDDQDELHRRLADIAQAEGIDLRELDALTLRSLAGEDALLALEVKGGALKATSLFNEIEKHVTEIEPRIVVLDTLADLFPGNENDRAQARQFIGLLRGLAIRFDCAVLLLAHPSLTGINTGTGTSGSTAWNNSVRSRLYLERIVSDGYEPNPDARVLTTKKSNYSRIGGEIRMTWTAGVFIADAPMSAGEAMNAGLKAERVFLKLLKLFAEQGRDVSAKPSPSYAPKIFAAHPEAEGITKRAFTQAMEALLRDGKVRIAERGAPSRRVSFLELVE